QQLDGISPQHRRVTQHRATALFFEQDAVVDVMRKNEAAIAREIDIDNLNVRLAPGQVVLPGQCAPDLAIADIVMDRLDPESRLSAVVGYLEQTEAADKCRTQILKNKALVAVVCPGMTQHPITVSLAGYVGKPFLILIARIFADTIDIAHHRESERIGVETAEA